MAAFELLGLARFLELPGCVLANRLQHREPTVRVAEKALVDERLERVESTSATCSASPSVQPPANAESLAKARCSAASSSS